MRGADVVFDVATATATVPMAVDLARSGGRILLAGLKHFDAIPGLVTDHIVLKSLQLFGGAGFTPASMAAAVALIESGEVRADVVAGEVFDLDHIDDAMALLTRSVPGRDAVRVGLKHTQLLDHLAWQTRACRGFSHAKTGIAVTPGTVGSMLYINGEWRDAASGATFASTNPATGEEIGTAADGGVADMQAAIEAADAAFGEWSARTAYERSKYLYQAHQLMLERREALAKLMTEEQGKPIRMARNEVGYAADFLLWFAEEAKRVYGETIPSARADQRFLVLRQPVGVVGAITPWNYPVSMLTRKIAPALAAGCTIVLKPAEQTPLLRGRGVQDLRGGRAARGRREPRHHRAARDRRRRAGHPPARAQDHLHRLDRGRQAHRAAGRGRREARVSMELGGHAPFIVFDDADPVHAAKGAAAVKFLNTGQACICPNRMLVQRGIAEQFIATHGGALRQAAGRQRLHRRRDRRTADRRRRAGEDGAPGRRRASTRARAWSPAASASPPTASTPAASTRPRCSPTSRPTC